MRRFKTHICLISQQPDANLFPLLDKKSRPDTVVLCVTEDMHRRGELFAQAARELAINVHELFIEDPCDIEGLKFQLAATIKQSDDPVLNLTCGTKQMMIAGYLAASLTETPWFYTSHTDNATFFYSSNDQLEESFESPVSPEDFELSVYAKAHGFVVETVHDEPLSQEECKFITHACSKTARNAIPNLNRLCSTAKNNSYDKLTAESSFMTSGMKSLLTIPMQQDWVRQEGQHLHFENENRRDFLNGFWFERFCRKALREMLPEKTSVWNLKEHNVDNSMVSNEADAAFFFNNRLYLIEVKTIRFKTDQKDSQKIKDFPKTEEIKNQDIIHKLSELRKSLGGIACHACLFSLFPVTDYMRERAQSVGIHVIDGNSLCRDKKLAQLQKINLNIGVEENFKRCLCEWISNTEECVN